MDPFMVAFMVANRTKALWGYIITVLASVLGGITAYLLAALFINQIFNLFTPEMTHGFHQLVKLVDRGPFLFSFLGSFSPVPYTLVAITAGALKVNVLLFIVGSLVGRAIRFGVVAYVVYFFGPRAVEIAKRNVLLISVIIVLLVSIFILFRLHL
jgi:membrane protein YqaA with SNARE-associated domain